MGSGKDTVLLQLEKFFGKKDSVDTYVKLGILALLLICIFSRICLYLFPKDLWLDEALLYEAIASGKWSELLRGHLINMQSAPLLYILLNKFIITYVGHTSQDIYFFPFLCSIISVFLIFLISKKIGNNFYVLFTLFIFSFCCRQALYYSAEFKQYSSELCISLILIYALINSLREGTNFLSLKYIFLYCICILFSSSAILFLAGLLGARALIAWHRKALRQVCANWWKILLLLTFVVVYYFFFLQYGNSEGMQEYWRPYLIPWSWDGFWEYWPSQGFHQFKGLFYPLKSFGILSNSAGMLFLGLVGGSIQLWRARRELFLFFTVPVMVTFIANFVFYPPAYRLLLFLVPNAVFVAGWFYACLFRRIVRLLAFAGENGALCGRLRVYAGRLGILCIVFALVGVSVLSNKHYLYAKGHHKQQIAELVRIFQNNSTPDSLNLVYDRARPAYQYYRRGPKLQVEILPLELAPVQARLEHLPKDRRVLILFSHYWKIGKKGLEQFEAMWKEEGRQYIKIETKGAVLYILSKMV